MLRAFSSESQSSVSSTVFEIEDTNVTLYYGPDVTFGGLQLEGHWFLSMYSNERSQHGDYDYKNDGTLDYVVDGTITTSETIKYGLTEDQMRLYTQTNSILYTDFISKSDSGVFKGDS